ncbi:MAG: hypothetical protein AAFN10_10255 [Bacteroidota bacterium]
MITKEKIKAAASIIVDDLKIGGQANLCDAQILGDFIRTAFQLTDTSINNVAQEIHDQKTNGNEDFFTKKSIRNFLRDRLA